MGGAEAVGRELLPRVGDSDMICDHVRGGDQIGRRRGAGSAEVSRRHIGGYWVGFAHR